MVGFVEFVLGFVLVCVVAVCGFVLGLFLVGDAVEGASSGRCLRMVSLGFWVGFRLARSLSMSCSACSCAASRIHWGVVGRSFLLDAVEAVFGCDGCDES